MIAREPNTETLEPRASITSSFGSRGLWLLSALTVAYASAGFSPWLLGNRDDSFSSGTLIGQILPLALGGLLVWLARRDLRASELLNLPLPLVVFVLLAICSTAWSLAPGTTFRRCISLIVTIGIAAVMVRGQSIDRFVSAVACGLTVVIVASVATELMGIATPVDESDFVGQPVDHSAWTGVFFTRNELGRGAAMCALFAMAAAVMGAQHRKLCLASAALGGFVVIKSGSAGGLVLLVASVLTLAIATSVIQSRVFRSSILPLLAPLTAAVAVGVFAILGWQSAAAALGRDSTLTGRTVYWSFAIDSLAQQPWFGYGYSSFWSALSGPAGNLATGLDAVVPSAHSGYIEVMLGLGLVGLIVCVTVLVQAFARAVRLIARRDRFGPVALATSVAIVCYSFVESALFAPGALLTIVLIAVFLASAPGGVGTSLGRRVGRFPR